MQGLVLKSPARYEPGFFLIPLQVLQNLKE